MSTNLVCSGAGAPPVRSIRPWEPPRSRLNLQSGPTPYSPSPATVQIRTPPRNSSAPGADQDRGTSPPLFAWQNWPLSFCPTAGVGALAGAPPELATAASGALRDACFPPVPLLGWFYSGAVPLFSAGRWRRRRERQWEGGGISCARGLEWVKGSCFRLNKRRVQHKRGGIGSWGLFPCVLFSLLLCGWGLWFDEYD